MAWYIYVLIAAGVGRTVALVFVWRSFYGMRIPVEAQAPVSSTKAVRA